MTPRDWSRWRVPLIVGAGGLIIGLALAPLAATAETPHRVVVVLLGYILGTIWGVCAAHLFHGSRP